jgi:hypothetical protein
MFLLFIMLGALFKDWRLLAGWLLSRVGASLMFNCAVFRLGLRLGFLEAVLILDA